MCTRTFGASISGIYGHHEIRGDNPSGTAFSPRIMFKYLELKKIHSNI